jgi:hypothetical protein
LAGRVDTFGTEVAYKAQCRRRFPEQPDESWTREAPRTSAEAQRMLLQAAL